jgi:hypothetical protein
VSYHCYYYIAIALKQIFGEMEAAAAAWHLCVCVRVRACVCVRVCACVCASPYRDGGEGKEGHGDDEEIEKAPVHQIHNYISMTQL